MDILASADESLISSLTNSVIKRDIVDLHSQGNILVGLNDQRENRRFSDAALHCRGEIIHAHKCVLGCVSKYFETLFTTPLTRSATPVHVVNLDEYSPQVVNLLVDLIYTQVDIPHSSLIELLKLAVFVQYERLVTFLVEAIRPLISDTNVLQWLEVGHQCGCQYLIWLTECLVREDFARLYWRALFNWTRDKKKLHYVENSKIRRETKELVHITIEDKRELILDVDRILLSSYHPEEGSHIDCMLNANISPSPSYIFVRDGMIFAISIKGGFKWSFTVVNLLKYRHCSSSFEHVKRYEFHSCSYESPFYDGKNSLYLQMEVNEELLIYKIDLISGTMCDGYINLGQNSNQFEVCEKQKLHPLHDGMYSLSLDTIVKVSDFDFDQTDNHDAGKIPLSEQIPGLCTVSVAKKRNHGITYFESCNGNRYCVLPPKMWEDYRHCILKLDLQTRSWVYIGDCNCEYVTELFCCNKTICIVSNRNIDDETNAKEIFFFDEVTGKVQETSIELPVSGFETFFNFPVFVNFNNK